MKIIKFYGTNCPECKKLDEWLESKKLGSLVSKSYNIDTELGADFALEFKIMRVPALVKLDDNNIPYEIVAGFDKKQSELFFDDI